MRTDLANGGPGAPPRADTGPPAGGARRRLVVAWVIGIAVLGLAILVAGAPTQDEPLDPRSVGPSGLRGVVDLLGHLDVGVTVGLDVPDDTDARVFVPLDRLSADGRRELAEWVRTGGTLVVADHGSPLHDLPPVAGGFADTIGVTVRAPDCDLEALADVHAIAHSGWDLYGVPEDATSCFATEAGPAWLVVRPEGAGTIVALGSSEPFTNALLDRDDNAVLAAALLGPRPGDRLIVMPRGPVGEGETAMTDLIADRVWDGLLLLLAAAVTAVLWRGRRLGQPVSETLPPVVPSAELARSVGDLLQRAGSRQGAADRLRADARAAVRTALGTTPTLATERLAELATRRLDVEVAVARTALVDAPVVDDGTLVAVSRATQAVRRATGAGPPPRTPPIDQSIDKSMQRSTSTSPDGPGIHDTGASP